MTDQPNSNLKLRAFITAVTFADGSVHINAMAMPNEACAMTTSGVAAGRQFQGQFAGFAYVELSAEFLRSMLRSIEAGKPSGEVVALVSDNPKPAMGGDPGRPPTPEEVADQIAPWAARRQHPESFRWGEGSSVPQSAWGLTNTIGRCEVHPHAPLLNGRCPVCQATGGAA